MSWWKKTNTQTDKCSQFNSKIHSQTQSQSQHRYWFTSLSLSPPISLLLFSPAVPARERRCSLFPTQTHTHTHTHTHDTQTHKPIGKYPAKFCSSRMTVVCAEVVGWPSARTSTIWAVIYLRHTFFPFFFSNRCQQSLPLKPWDLMCVCNRGSNQNLFRQQSPQIKTISWRERPKSCQMFSFFLFLLFLVLYDWVRRC